MRFRMYGYTEKTIEVREVSICDIVTSIAQGLIRENKQDMEIRIVDLFMGEVTTYAGIDDMMIKGFNTDYKVHVFNINVMHDNVRDCDYVKVLMADDVDEVPVLIEKE